jgi:hypothetical protein
LSIFTVQPSTPYNILIGQPGVSGTPTPTVSYAWTYNGTAIGGNSRFVNGYTFPSLPGTLACTITLTNIAGSVSQTVSASIEQASNLPVLSPVTIRDNASPTAPISTIANGNAGVVLRVGGPSSPDLNPVSANASSITYQWRRDAADVAGATSQTYTLVEADEDATITVVVTASNPDGEVSRVASLRVGDALPNANSHIGGHAPAVTYYGSDVAFTNLIYASVAGPARLVSGLNGQGRNFFGSERYLDWTGASYYSHDGWPYRSDAGPLSRSNAVHINLVWHGKERMWSVLGLRGGFDTPPVATLNENGQGSQYPAPLGIAGRSFSFKATCYWEGQGIAVAGRGQVPPTPQVQTIEFTGPEGHGPFGDGPRSMKRSAVQYTATGDSPGGLLAYIIESDSTGTDPLRNLIVLISDVRDAATGELIYAGFDHTTYRPFQLYPDWVESMRHFSHLRSLQNEFARGTPTAELLIHEDTGLEYQWHQESHGSTHLLTTGWSRPAPSAPGFERGFAAINRPTHVGFGRSLRAIIEMCNQLDADLWWCHPAPTVFVGTRNSNGSIQFARLRGETESDPNQVGSILIDHDYVEGFIDEISAHLKPGLKVYSEWVNEVWNASSAYVWATRYAWTSAMRTLAPVEYGGDGGLWFAKRTLESPAIYTGVDLKADANTAMAAFSAAASALLAEGIRERLGPESDREIVCVAAGQSNWRARSALGLGQLWAAMPYLFKHLDAVAHAPYRDPILIWPHNSAESDQHLVETLGTAEGAWDAYEAAGMLQPPSDPTSWWISGVRDNGANLNYGLFLYWKHLALDLPSDLGSDTSNSYARQYAPMDWPANKRRWNLDLLTYEGGTHTLPGNKASDYRTPARLLMYSVVLEPRNSLFYRRYLETTFMPGPKGLTRDPASESEEALYRPGMVPMGVVENAEPLHDRFTFLVTIGQPSFLHGMFWALQWWNGHMNAAPAAGAKDAVQLGIGTPNWWLNYSGGSE